MNLGIARRLGKKKMIILNTKPKKMIKSHIPKEYADNAVYFFQGTQTKNMKLQESIKVD